MAPLFFEEGKIPGNYNPDIFTNNWKALVDMKMGIILGLFIDGVARGFLGMIVMDDINDGNKTCQEAFWYVHPDHRGSGLRLLLAAEKMAKELSCKKMTMVHLLNPAGEKLSRIFTRMGYRPIETHYVREL